MDGLDLLSLCKINFETMFSDVFALVYLSTSLVAFDKARINELAQHASEKNKRLQISGYLCFKDGLFFQYLEGSQGNVVGLMDQIEKDSRHEVLNLIHIGNIKERKFRGWDMRYLEDAELKNMQLEDMFKWIITSMKTEIMAYESLKENIQKMIQQIVLLRRKKLIS